MSQLRGKRGHFWWIGLLVTLLVIGTGSSFYVWYCSFGNDIAPDSPVGFGYAIAGTLCFVLAAILYTVRRRSPRRAMGQLHAALNWHVFLAIMGLALLLMHSFGNFNAKTGTFALYALVILLASGFVGRAIDRIVPRLIAGEVDKVLTAEGEDRVEVISRNLQSIAAPSSPKGNGSPTSFFGVDDQAVSTPWDMAYVSFKMSSLSVAEKQENYTFPRNRSDIPLHPGLFMYHVRQQVAEISRVQQAIQREQFYRCIIRYWRLFHVTLALLTIGLVIWHLIFVAQLLMPTFMR